MEEKGGSIDIEHRRRSLKWFQGVMRVLITKLHWGKHFDTLNPHLYIGTNDKRLLEKQIKYLMFWYIQLECKLTLKQEDILRSKSQSSFWPNNTVEITKHVHSPALKNILTKHQKKEKQETRYLCSLHPFILVVLGHGHVS